MSLDVSMGTSSMILSTSISINQILSDFDRLSALGNWFGLVKDSSVGHSMIRKSQI